MSRRDRMTPEQREADRTATRERMARLRQDPDYRAAVNERRRQRDQERKSIDPDLRTRLHANRKRYYRRKKGDPDFEAKRAEYLRRWRSERRIDEEFDAFVSRMEAAE